MKKEITVTQPTKPIPVQIMAQAIVDISKAMKQIKQSRLKRDVILILLKDKTGYSKAAVGQILDALEQLEDLYLKPNII